MGLGWRLVSSRIFPNNVFSWTLFRHSAFVRFDGPIFETEKLFENLCTTRGLPCTLPITVDIPWRRGDCSTVCNRGIPSTIALHCFRAILR